MSKLILKMSMSLDGFVADANGDNAFIFSSMSEDASAWTMDTLCHTAAHLMGSRTYRDMAAHWSQSDSVFAAPMNDLPKIVFSDSMTTAAWGETRIVAGDLAQEIAKLKADRAGGYLLAHGGARFARSLVRHGPDRRVPTPFAPGGLGRRQADLPRPDGLRADLDQSVQQRRCGARLPLRRPDARPVATLSPSAASLIRPSVGSPQRRSAISDRRRRLAPPAPAHCRPAPPAGRDPPGPSPRFRSAPRSPPLRRSPRSSPSSWPCSRSRRDCPAWERGDRGVEIRADRAECRREHERVEGRHERADAGQGEHPPGAPIVEPGADGRRPRSTAWR